MTFQDASEVVKQGNNIILYIGMGVTITMVAFDKVYKFFVKNKGDDDKIKKAVEETISTMANNKKDGTVSKLHYNPHPPGEAIVCQNHTELLEANQKETGKLAISLAGHKGEMKSWREGVNARLGRIETKMNGFLKAVK